MRVLWYGDATAVVCIPCKCVCMCVAPLPSDPHECVSEVHVLGVASWVCVALEVCVRTCGGKALQ